MSKYLIRRIFLKGLLIYVWLGLVVAPLINESFQTDDYLGLFFAIVCCYLLINGMWFFASLILLISGFFDMLDGALARYSDTTTSFGKFLDSFVDRVCESLILAGILIYFIFVEQNDITALLVYTSICTSLIVSYSRARAESLGVESKDGLMTRAPRVITLTIGIFTFSFLDNS